MFKVRPIYMTILGSVMLLEMLLWGSTLAPLMYSSSLIATSSPRTVMFSTLAHRPTDEFHPMMDDMIHAWSLTLALAMTTHRCRRTPAPILAPGPMTTLGPMLEEGRRRKGGKVSGS